MNEHNYYVNSNTCQSVTSDNNCKEYHIDEFDNNLLAAIKLNPCLYDNRKVSKETLDKCWRDISNYLEVPEDQCRVRYKRIREYYAKERQRREFQDTGVKRFSKAGWPLYEAASFLGSYIKKRGCRKIKADKNQATSNFVLNKNNMQDINEGDAEASAECNLANVGVGPVNNEITINQTIEETMFEPFQDISNTSITYDDITVPIVPPTQDHNNHEDELISRPHDDHVQSGIDKNHDSSSSFLDDNQTIENDTTHVHESIHDKIRKINQLHPASNMNKSDNSQGISKNIKKEAFKEKNKACGQYVTTHLKQMDNQEKRRVLLQKIFSELYS